MEPRSATVGYENIRAEGDARMHNGNIYNNTTNHHKHTTPYHDIPKKETNDPVHADLTRACAKRATAHRLGYLMREGADIEYRDEAGCTPLHHAVFGGSVDTVRWILQAGADVNAVNDWFGTPLCLAAIRGNLAVTELLIEHNADLNQECSNLGSAAHAACASGDIAIVQAVHSGGARWNVRRKTCAEALSHLIQLPQDEGLLLPYHKLLETRVRQRQSPRAIAIKFRHSGVVDFYSGLGKGLSVNETCHPTDLPTTEAPKRRRTAATNNSPKNGHSRATGRSQRRSTDPVARTQVQDLTPMMHRMGLFSDSDNRKTRFLKVGNTYITSSEWSSY